MKRKIEIRITMRSVFYLVYILIVQYFIVSALINFYKPVIAITFWLMLCLSWPLSMYLINYKEE